MEETGKSHGFYCFTFTFMVDGIMTKIISQEKEKKGEIFTLEDEKKYQLLRFLYNRKKQDEKPVMIYKQRFHAFLVEVLENYVMINGIPF